MSRIVPGRRGGTRRLARALLVAAAIWLVPVNQLIDPGIPAAPGSPPYQSRYPFGAKAIPQPDLLLPVPPTPSPAPPEPPSTEPASPRFSR